MWLDQSTQVRLPGLTVAFTSASFRYSQGLVPISRKLNFGRVRGLSRKTIEVPLASKKQSPPVRGIGSAIPSTLSQQLPRESMAKCAKSVGKVFLPEGVIF